MGCTSSSGRSAKKPASPAPAAEVPSINDRFLDDCASSMTSCSDDGSASPTGWAGGHMADDALSVASTCSGCGGGAARRASARSSTDCGSRSPYDHGPWLY
eukprot:CAMPEP_0171285826 /NCGR_PEP_ID=MMETSP0790-20130122/68678_1 /TAXON_ID=2925 /ORGANISM="Alexandrium catenella, Strain OF101" /LENGTH=100 /DNA_ID=CAMNT_0011755213 /DNA_START=108 /DNA_END=410 /DNA_ORIENTATION=+